MNDPKDTRSPNDQSPNFDDSHASHHHIQGTYDHAITQKGAYGDSTFQSWTDVDGDGNVGDAGFGNFGKK